MAKQSKHPMLHARRTLIRCSGAILAVTTGFGITPAHALFGFGSIAGTGGASEVTQLLNYAELVGQTAKQAASVAEQIKTEINTANQLIAMAQNLNKLPEILFQEQLKPFKGTVSSLSTLYSSVDGVRKAATNTSYLLNSRALSAKDAGLDMKSYWLRELDINRSRGNIYKERFAADMAAIKNLKERAAQLESVAAATKAVSGNLEGLTLLNQQATMQADELMQIRSVLIAQSSEQNAAKQAAQDQKSIKGLAFSGAGDEGDKRSARNEGISFKLPAAFSDAP